MAKQKGRLIAFEGADGSGKTTQAKLLLKYLKKHKISSVYISFPRYEVSMWGAMVKRYLAGEFGKLNEVDPYLASMLYAGDRAVAAASLKKWIGDGKMVVCNRYTGSNLAHMAAKLGGRGEKSRFIDWLEKLEYGENKIPKEDLVIFLHVPVAVSRKLIENRKLDIHEADLSYLSKVLGVYEDFVTSRRNWIKVDCTKNGRILSFSAIHQKVLEILKQRKFI